MARGSSKKRSIKLTPSSDRNKKKGKKLNGHSSLDTMLDDSDVEPIGDDGDMPEDDGPVLEVLDQVDIPMPDELERKPTFANKAGNPYTANKKLLGEYRKDYPAKVAKMVLNGATRKDLIVALQTKESVFNMWATMYPEFAAALTITKSATLADERVKRSMYEMAVGYEQPAIKFFNNEGKITQVQYNERVQPSMAAAKFWLEQRDRLNWGQGAEGRGDNAPPSQISMEALRGMTTEQLRDVALMVRNIMSPAQSMRRLDVVEAETVEIEIPPEQPVVKKTRPKNASRKA